MAKSRILLIRLNEDELGDIGGGVVVQVVVTHANIGVSVEDDLGRSVEYGRVDLRDMVVRE